MRQVEPRRIIRLSSELADLIPALQALSYEYEKAGIKAGIWEDKGYYVFGESRYNDAPESVTFVLSPSEWNFRQRMIPRGKKFSVHALRSQIHRASLMYPDLFEKEIL